MTLCVAAACRMDRKPRVLIASDYQTESDMVGAEIEHKMAFLSDNHVALLAGTTSRAIEFTYAAHAYFQTPEGSGLDTLDKLKEVARIHKHRLADEYIAGKLGISYDHFLSGGREKLPPEVFRELAAEIAHMGLGCALIVMTFADGEPRLFRVHDTGMVEICSNFCAIGTGMYIAESLLFLREHRDDFPLREAAYNIYEAMRLGSRAPGVGDQFSIEVFSAGNGSLKHEYLTDECFEYLERQTLKFGFKRVGKMEFRSDFIRGRR